MLVDSPGSTLRLLEAQVMRERRERRGGSQEQVGTGRKSKGKEGRGSGGREVRSFTALKK